jgi:hypothetical protein
MWASIWAKGPLEPLMHMVLGTEPG